MSDPAVTRRDLIITIGLPGSGKTTWARKQVAAHPPGEVVRVNRDDVRRMLHGGWVGSRFVEAQVTAVQRAGIRFAFAEGARVVIVDDTNLDPLHRNALVRLAAEVGACPRVQEFRDVPLTLCLARNALRSVDEQIPESVICAMHREWIEGIRL